MWLNLIRFRGGDDSHLDASGSEFFRIDGGCPDGGMLTVSGSRVVLHRSV